LASVPNVAYVIKSDGIGPIVARLEFTSALPVSGYKIDGRQNRGYFVIDFRQRVTEWEWREACGAGQDPWSSSMARKRRFAFVIHGRLVVQRDLLTHASRPTPHA
jgi:hypothetical protein